MSATSDVEKRYHERWLGFTQPHEGLVVSVPVLVDAQCMLRLEPEVHARFRALTPARRTGSEGPEGEAIGDLDAFLEELLGYKAALVHRARALPEALKLYAAEGRQTIRPTLAVPRRGAFEPATAESTPASDAGQGYLLLLWDLADEATGAGEAGVGLPLDAPESLTGPWEYPPAAKFDRLLRHCRVPIGVLTNREVVRLVYAPHGESSGHIDFRVHAMGRVDGRPILDALVMLLHARRLLSVPEDKRLPAILKQSRERQANVTSELAAQVFDGLSVLLRGFEAAAERDKSTLLDEAVARSRADGAQEDHVYQGLLTVLLRLVFLLYAEDRGLLPVEHPTYAEHYSVLGLFARLQADAAAHPDSMHARFGAWGQLLAIFRAVFLGLSHGDLQVPPRRGALFDPNAYPFLEGWGPGGAAPIVLDEDRAAVKVPTLDDETVHHVLEKLLVFQGQRLSYRTLDVEQIGSIYEALMGYQVARVPDRAVCLRPSGVWVTVAELLEQAPRLRPKWLKEQVGLMKAQAEALSREIEAAADDASRVEALARYAVTGRGRDKALSIARPEQLVLQPGSERRRTSSHYTPRSLTEPIVRRTMEPLLATMGEVPTSDAIVELKVCDPAMGSGAFLVESCRFLADRLVEAWTREGKLDEIASEAPGQDPVLHARRVVAQCCLYGVDRNRPAVELAKLSLWLFTLAKDLPFTFVDHALRHGDSLVGLSFEQINAFHWDPAATKKGAQTDFAQRVLKEALAEAIDIRKGILALARDASPGADTERRLRMQDAMDASERARIVGDLVVGAFFAADKPKGREDERKRRATLAERWLRDGDEEARRECERLSAEIRARLPIFHWMLEFPEVFYAARPDPLDGMKANKAAFMDAFVGNPPFAGKNAISESSGADYIRWLQAIHSDAHGNADLCAHFLRRCALLIGMAGTVGFVTTNSLSQGDTRATGLAVLLRNRWVIYDANRRLPWIGGPNVAIAVVCVARGDRLLAGIESPRLDGVAVATVNSRFRPQPERDSPRLLSRNQSLCFMGSTLLGEGFFLTDDERLEFIGRDPRNAERIFPYLSGEHLNTDPLQGSDRYAIDFGDMPLEAANAWPDLVIRLETLVKAERQNQKRDPYRRRWWQYAERRSGLYGAIAHGRRCIVAAQTTKYLCFSMKEIGHVFSAKVIVVASESFATISVLQSRIHDFWVRLLASTLDDRAATARISYVIGDCFETFPFPEVEPRAVVPALEAIGEELYEARAKYMLETQQGLTQTYNRLKDPSCEDEPIVALRVLHEQMDQAVLEAYARSTGEPAWLAVPVPPFCPRTPEEQKALETFSDHVVDRLFVLNAQRAADEEKRGLRGGKRKSGAKAKRASKAKPAPADGGETPKQGELKIDG